MQQLAPRAEHSSKWSVTLGPGWGWASYRLGSETVWLKGYVVDGMRTLEGESAARHVASALRDAETDDALASAFGGLGGHFACVIEAPHRAIACVDRIRTIPLAYATRSGATLIDDRATRLRDTLGLGPGDIDASQALAAAMSGYTIGAATLYDGMRSLRPGEALIVDRKGHRVLRWFLYDAWRTEEIAAPDKRLSDLNRRIMERLAASADGRTICVPLSAGYDSRFIAAGLKAVGARNVRTFSYGRAGNHEAETARTIAERLGFPWRFVPFTSRTQAAMFADPEHEKALWRTADSCTAVPFEQDWRAIEVLKRDGYIPADAIVVNGQTGDYISGNHAPPELMEAPRGESREARRQRVLAAYLKKHCRLWEALATASNDAIVGRLVAAEAEATGATFGADEALHGIHEMLEYQDRQAKYVVSGQRTYEAMGLSWRLPLWDDEYIHFWRRAPAELKRGQGLYKRVLEADDWGGVFSGIPVNRKTIRPAWIRPARLVAKVMAAPLGKDAWHRLERRAFGWWMDQLCVSAVVPYSRALGDTRGARHAVSWLTERWLGRHGTRIDRLSLPSEATT